MNGGSYPQQYPSVAIFSSRKMRKNFVGVTVVVLAGILICFALVNLVLMTDQDLSLDGSTSRLSLNRVSFRSLKGNRRSISKASDMYSNQPGFLHKSVHFVPDLRVVHLDLKGAPPSISYLKEIFPLIAKAGGNALLIEYEDMFPYSGSILNTSALNAFTVTQIGELVEAAKSHQLEVIPLVQTFGHFEHVLKLEEFVHLREVPNNPQSLCPSKPESFQLVKLMIDQVMALHKDIKFLHIGCDEVFQLGQCSSCKHALKDQGRIPRDLFVEHVQKVANYVKTQYHVQPIIWDDMLRTMSPKDLQDSQLGELVEPMVWVYVEDIDHFVDGPTWAKYSATFPHIWAASAYKGAFGERLFMPNMLRHYRNHLAWIEVLDRESSTFGHGKPSHFRGLALTGWSRYDHFAVLCELLPVALPSLLLNLEAISSNGSEVVKFRLAEKLLKCSNNDGRYYDRLSPMSLEQDPHQYELRRCKFPGAKVFGAVGSLVRYKAEVEALDTISRETQGWLTSYNIRHNYTSPWRLSETLSGHAELHKSLIEYKEKTGKTLSSIFDAATVDEWVEQNIRPLQEKTEKLLAVVDKLTARNTWPRRPIP